MQVDVYMPNPWNSGMLAWRMDKDGGTLNSNRIMNIAPWTVGNPFVLSTEVKETYTLETWLAEYAMKRNSTTGIWSPCISLFTFANGNFMRNNGNNTPDPQWACVNIVNFEMGLANMRLVPLTPVAFE